MTFPLRILLSLKMKTKIHTLKLPVIIRPRNRKQCKDWSPQEFNDAKAKADLNWIKLSSPGSDQITEINFSRNGSLVVFSCFRESKEAMGIEHGLREELILSPRIRFENYPSRKAFGVFRLILSDSHSSTFSDLINQWLLWKLCYTLRKKKETKLTKKRLSLWHRWSLCWTFKHRRQPKTE